MNIAVIGGHKCSMRLYNVACKLGELIAQEKWILICGGRTGIMEAVCKGAKVKNGRTVGILPSYDGKDVNPYVDIKLPTGLGYARNVLVVRAADIIVAIGGNYGTLSEIAFALSEDKYVIGINTWNIKGIKKVENAEQALICIKKRMKLT